MNTDKRTATQRIEDLEKVVTMFFQTMAQHKSVVEELLKAREGSVQDMALVKEALKLLNKKLEAVVQVAAPESGITLKSVSDLVTKMNVEEFKAQVASSVAGGFLAVADIVADDSYLVVEEVNAQGVVENPRAQFRLNSLSEETTNLFKGKKVGDLIVSGENKLDIRILEIYTVTEPKAPEADETAASEAVATETSASTSNASESAAASSSDLAELPAETPVSFGLNIHGQPDPAMATA
jgi:hypothetical protein